MTTTAWCLCTGLMIWTHTRPTHSCANSGLFPAILRILPNLNIDLKLSCLRIDCNLKFSRTPGIACLSALLLLFVVVFLLLLPAPVDQQPDLIRFRDFSIVVRLHYRRERPRILLLYLVLLLCPVVARQSALPLVCCCSYSLSASN